MSLYERISQVVSLTLLGLVAYFLIELPDRTLELIFMGTPLTLVISQRWLMALLLSGLAGTGTSAIVRAHPLLTRWRSGSQVKRERPGCRDGGKRRKTG